MARSTPGSRFVYPGYGQQLQITDRDKLYDGFGEAVLHASRDSVER